jgi:hypothetical protein
MNFESWKPGSKGETFSFLVFEFLPLPALLLSSEISQTLPQAKGHPALPPDALASSSGYLAVLRAPDRTPPANKVR